jgi:curved DNA-binding protein CbpA
MVTPADPYRVLGLERGASTQEVKAAYRRLVKAFHPDAAGEKATARFLAIQAAYDAITAGTPAAFRATSGREPWRADPDRARTTRDRERTPPRGERARPAGQAAPGSQPRGDPEGGQSRAGKRRNRRERPRATPGSTTYDEAASETFSPDWSGASWYGTTSGTYWTINPREYADPRKHGPEYEARARRAWAREDMTWEGNDAGASPDDTTDEERPEPGQDEGYAASDARQPGPPSEGFRPAFQREAAAEVAAAPAPAGFDPLSMLPLPAGFPSRAVLALLGWPPLGFAFAAIVSDASGCGRFAASCVDTFDVGTWVGQLAILAVLLALPRLASISAIGTLAMLAVSVPGAVLLSAAGGAQQRDVAASALTVLLVIAYLAGVVFAVARSLRAKRT